MFQGLGFFLESWQPRGTILLVVALYSHTGACLAAADATYCNFYYYMLQGFDFLTFRELGRVYSLKIPVKLSLSALHSIE